MTLRIFVPKSRNHFNIPDGSAPFRSSRTAPFAGSAQMEDVGRSSPEPAIDSVTAAGAISVAPFSFFPKELLLLEADKPVHIGSRALDIPIAIMSALPARCVRATGPRL